MSKHLQAVIKACRYLLEQDFTDPCQNQKPHEHDKLQREPIRSSREHSVAFLVKLAIIRCFEEQLWRNPTQLVFSPDVPQVIQRLGSVIRKVQAELPFVLRILTPPEHSPTSSALKTLLHHFTVMITPEEWRSEHILGWIYQYSLENSPEQKQQGQFYTPEPIADYIVSQTLEMVQTEDIEHFALLDLACGAGVFALRAFERLYERYRQENRRAEKLPWENISQRILEKHLFLVDKDPRACQLAAINLYLKAKRLEPSCHINTMNIFCADALRRWEGESPPAPPHHAADVNADSSPPLVGGVRRGGNYLNKLFTRCYDVVVGNPPYIVINQLQTPKDLIRLYKSYQSAAFKINTFALFIERGIDLLKPTGCLGMIVPNTLFTQVYFEPLRAYILAACNIRRILDTKPMFDNASVENCILLLQREQDKSRRHLNMIECRVRNRDKEKNASRTVVSKPEIMEDLVGIPQRHFEKAPLNMFNVHIDEQTFTLMEKIANGNPTLGEICESHDGVNPGNAKHKLIVSEKPDETCQKVLNGKNIGRYWLRWDGLYVRYTRTLLTKSDNVRWGHQRSLDSEKIVTRQTADRLMGTFDDGQYYTTNSIHTTILRPGVREFHLKYLLALLNSKVMSFYYRKFISEAGQLFAQVKLVNLRQMPIKQIAPAQQQEIIASVDALLQERSRIPKPDTLVNELNSDEMMWWCRLKEWDDQIDQQIYDHYDMTSEDIQLIEQEMGPAICLYPRISAAELENEIPYESFRSRYANRPQTIFQMAEHFQIHPISILELGKQYHLL